MKAKIGNIEFEGTPEEMRSLIRDIEVETTRKVIKDKSNCENFDDGDTKVAPKGEFKADTKQSTKSEILKDYEN